MLAGLAATTHRSDFNFDGDEFDEIDERGNERHRRGRVVRAARGDQGRHRGDGQSCIGKRLGRPDNPQGIGATGLSQRCGAEGVDAGTGGVEDDALGRDRVDTEEERCPT